MEAKEPSSFEIASKQAKKDLKGMREVIINSIKLVVRKNMKCKVCGKQFHY